MNLRPYDDDDGRKVWLSQSEVELLLSHAKNTTEKVALGLAVRSGLRTYEIVDVAPDDVVDTDAGTMLRVHHGKGDKHASLAKQRTG